jgi:hypothetical protein
MAANSITSAQVGTAVVAVAGSLKGLAVTLPIAANADTKTPLILLDSTTGSGVILFSAFLSDLQSFMYALKPASVPQPPASPTAPVAGTVFTGVLPFTQGLYVKSCPANMTVTATT